MTQEVSPARKQKGRKEQGTTRTAGRAQGVLLISMSCLSVLGAVLLSPVQPQILAEYSGSAGASTLVPLIITTPALMVGLLAFSAGRIVDKVGRIRLLKIALVVYAVFGTAPLYLDSLIAIVASRVGVGIAEAAIMTCCTTLIADYFDGRARAKYLGLQVVFSSLSAVVFIGIGGALAQFSWRTPFWLYAIGLVLVLLVPSMLWQPKREVAAENDGGRLTPVAWKPLLIPLAVTLFGGIVFYTPIVELPYALSHVGVSSSGAIGAVSALVAIATAVGAISFTRIGSIGPKILLPSAFAAAGLGVLIVGIAPNVAVVAVGGIIASAGCGVLLPTLLTWVLGTLNFDERGRGTGAWTACLFIGEFFSALVVLGIGAIVGGLSGALVTVGVVTLLIAVVATRLHSVRTSVPAFHA